MKENQEEINKLKLALKLILFELSTMPPIPNFGTPFGVSYSIKLAKKALSNEEN